MRFTQVKMYASKPEDLAAFYEEALDCEVLLPLTSLEASAAKGIGEQGGNVQILVMSLPGTDGGTTLELIIHLSGEPGRGYLTFHVEDVGAAAERVIAAGGSYRGEVVDFDGPSGGRFRFVFMNDPEGNVVDLFARLD